MRQLKILLVVPLLAVVLVTSAPAAALAAAGPNDSLTVTNLSASSIDLLGFAPGDSSQWAARVHNPTSAKSSFSVEIRNPGAGKLTTNDINGLWLEFSLCPQPLTIWNSGGVRGFACPVAATPLGNAPAGSLVNGSDTASIAAGSTLDVLVTIRFPQTANNSFQNATGALTLAIVDHTPAARPLTPLAFTGPNFIGLAFTGADVLGALGAAVATFVIGFLMLVISRRRRRPAHTPSAPANCDSP